MANGKASGTDLTAKRSSNGATNDGPSTKRLRVSRACDQCRASREKCDGTHPKCSTCSSQDRTCSYNEQPKKRGIQPNYIRTLELVLAWTFQSFPDIEVALTQGLPNEDDTIHKIISGKDAATGETLHLAWRNCVVNKQLDQMLSGASIRNDGGFVGSGSLPDLDGLQRFQSNNQPPETFAHADQSNVLQPGTGSAQHSSHFYKLPDEAWTLLDHYFAFVHSFLPMTEKHNILKVMYSYPSGGLAGDQIPGAEHAELWSILALSAYQLFDDQKGDEARRIRRFAESLVPTGVSFEIPHIRSMILLTLIDASEGNMLAAWLRIGSVASLLLLFQLLEKLGNTAKFCRHIHLVAFIVEDAIASHLRAPRHLRSDYIEAVGLVDEDGLDEWAPWQDPHANTTERLSKAPARSFSTLNALVRAAMRRSDSHPGTLTADAVNADDGASTLFALLRNASLQGARKQPAILVANNTRAEEGSKQGSSFPFMRHNNEPLTTFDHRSTTNVGRVPSTTNEIHEPTTHSFMSIPNEINTVASDTGSAPAMQTLQSFQQTTPQSGDVTVFNENDFGSDINVFEAFDSMLERQDTHEHPQFMQNLGFNPDLDLAEFFGPDYLPSNPLLPYSAAGDQGGLYP